MKLTSVGKYSVICYLSNLWYNTLDSRQKSLVGVPYFATLFSGTLLQNFETENSFCTYIRSSWFWYCFWFDCYCNCDNDNHWYLWNVFFMGCWFQCFDSYQLDCCYRIIYWIYRFVQTWTSVSAGQSLPVKLWPTRGSFYQLELRSHGENICIDNEINAKRKSHRDYGSYGPCCYAWRRFHKFTWYYLSSLGIRKDFLIFRLWS